MRFFWEESKFLLRSKFLWIVSLLGVALCLWVYAGQVSYNQRRNGRFLCVYPGTRPFLS